MLLLSEDWPRRTMSSLLKSTQGSKIRVSKSLLSHAINLDLKSLELQKKLRLLQKTKWELSFPLWRRLKWTMLTAMMFTSTSDATLSYTTLLKDKLLRFHGTLLSSLSTLTVRWLSIMVQKLILMLSLSILWMCVNERNLKLNIRS